MRVRARRRTGATRPRWRSSPSVNAVIATVLWAYFASIAILLGGEFNAVLRRRPFAAALEARERAIEAPDDAAPRFSTAPREHEAA